MDAQGKIAPVCEATIFHPVIQINTGFRHTLTWSLAGHRDQSGLAQTRPLGRVMRDRVSQMTMNRMCTYEGNALKKT